MNRVTNLVAVEVGGRGWEVFGIHSANSLTKCLPVPYLASLPPPAPGHGSLGGGRVVLAQAGQNRVFNCKGEILEDMAL